MTLLESPFQLTGTRVSIPPRLDPDPESSSLRLDDKTGEEGYTVRPMRFFVYDSTLLYTFRLCGRRKQSPLWTFSCVPSDPLMYRSTGVLPLSLPSNHLHGISTSDLSQLVSVTAQKFGFSDSPLKSKRVWESLVDDPGNQVSRERTSRSVV